MLGVGQYPLESEIDADIVKAGKEIVTELPGTSYFCSADSVAMVDVGFAMRLGPPVPILGPLHLEAQISFGTKMAEDFQQIESEFNLAVAQVGVRSVRPIRRWLRGFARAATPV